MRPRSRPLTLRAATGLTIVELLVVISILTVLAALLVPAIQSVRETARRITCANHLRQIALAMAHYESQFGTFPMGCLECRAPRLPGVALKRHSWNTFLLPYLGQQSIYQRFDFDQPFYAQANQPAGESVVATFLCPSTVTTRRLGTTTGDRNGNGRWDFGDGLAYTDYGGLYGVSHNLPRILPEHEGVMLYDRAVRAAEIRDGLSQTAIVGECTGRDFRQQSEWANGFNLFDQRFDNPINRSQDNELFSDHPRGCNVAFCDGHVAFLTADMDQAVLTALLTRAGAETIAAP